MDFGVKKKSQMWLISTTEIPNAAKDIITGKDYTH
jgi:hypothetical protein